MEKKIFREYDIRGVYPTEINEEGAYQIGRSYGSYLQEKYKQNVCVLGRDNRLSSPSLHESLLKGLTESGIDIIDLGVCTTPMWSFAQNKCHTFGIMITASHNPKDDNGFKFSFDELGNARGKQIYDFRDYTFAEKFLSGQGKVTNLDIFPYYKSLYKDNITMGDKKINVVIDPGNGTTSLFAEEIYKCFSNLNITMINNVSDATFPNHHPDPAEPKNLEQLQKKVLEIGADVGIAFDGDGDRVGFVDNKGNIMPADKFLCLVMSFYTPKMQDKRILYDVKCSKILEDVAKNINAEGIMYRTGASYTRAKIIQDSIPFGGEYSGHIVFNDRFKGFDSGIYSGLRMLEMLSNSNKALSNILDIKEYFNTPEIKIHADDNIKFTVIDEVIKYAKERNYEALTIDGIRIKFPTSWALIRCSNTGPNITLRFEATTQEEVQKLQDEYTTLVNNIIKNMA